MEQLDKSQYRQFVNSGFKPKYPVVKTQHGNFHYLVETDYNNYIKYLENKMRSR